MPWRERLLALFGLRTEAHMRQTVEAAAKSAFIEGHARGQQAGQHVGYQIGHAQGELHGRQQQTLELQQEFGIEDNRNIFDGEAALRYGSRLRH